MECRASVVWRDPAEDTCVGRVRRRHVPYDSFRRQRVLLVVAKGLAETLSSVVYVGKQGGVVPVQRVKATGELPSATGA